MNDTTTGTKQKRSIHRSPSYPAFPLKEAIDKARTIYDEEKRSYTTPEVIAKHLGFAQHIGGPGGRTMAALRAYGFLEETAAGTRLSDQAYHLIKFPAESPEYASALKNAIRKPSIFNDLLSQYPEGLPSDETLRSNLLRRGFNPESIGDVIRIFRETISLDSSQNVSYPSIQVGDYVQWESQGMLQFPKPQRVTRFSEDGKFAFFDGSNTGVPVAELEKAAPSDESEDDGKPFAIRRAPPKPGMNNDVFTLNEGDVVLQWPSKMSPESFEDFKDWLDLITRKAKRAVEKKDDSKSPASQDS